MLAPSPCERSSCCFAAVSVRRSALFVASAWVFIPNCSVENGRGEKDAIVKPGETRPLALKKSDDKACCADWLRKLRAALCAHAAPVQRGFIPNRNFVQNVIHLDVAARSFGTWLGQAQLPAVACWDFAAAFLSQARAWLKRVT